MLRIRSRVRKFIVVFPGRTGSTFLLSALRDHSQIRATGELIGRLKQQGAPAQEQAIRDWFRGRYFATERVVGFKTKLVDVKDRQRFAELLEEFDCRIIVMARENHVKHVVSRYNAKLLRDATDRWNLRLGDEQLPPVEIAFDEFDAALQKVVRHQNDIDAWIPKLDLHTLRITYETLLGEGQKCFDEVCDFVGVRHEAMQGRTEKATNDDLRLALSNFEELADRYRGTKYEPLFGYEGL